ncbi:ABC transporter permease [Neisseriaceae bacterium JH1-16]|nr:ABC transporter permease [Neisseriaceae bacterium JH1-16]
MNGFYTLFKKEVLRFWKVAFQTVSAPVLTALMYQLIFSHVLRSHVDAYPGVSYTAFLIPGLAMMSMAQNAFANGSSSLIQSKITGNIVFILLPPLGALEFFAAYLLAAVCRGLLVGLGVLVVTAWFGLPLPAEPLWALAFGLLGCGVLGTLGIIAGIWAEKFDQLAAFQNFLIMPLTFLSGVFYSINSLPPIWYAASHANPVFYMIDGFRYGFFGQADISPWLSLGVVGASFVALATLALWMIKTGYKLRH